MLLSHSYRYANKYREAASRPTSRKEREKWGTPFVFVATRIDGIVLGSTGDVGHPPSLAPKVRRVADSEEVEGDASERP